MDMDFRDENIVNISMRAAELFKAGKIKWTEPTGRSELREFIVDLAEEFAETYTYRDMWGYDTNDYLFTLYNFVDQELIERYGSELGSRVDNPALIQSLEQQIAKAGSRKAAEAPTVGERMTEIERE